MFADIDYTLRGGNPDCHRHGQEIFPKASSLLKFRHSPTQPTRWMRAMDLPEDPHEKKFVAKTSDAA